MFPLLRKGFLDAAAVARNHRVMFANTRVLAAMVYAALVVVTAMVNSSYTAVVAVVGAVLLGGFYVATRPRRDSPR
jgi:hypothetical protein